MAGVALDFELVPASQAQIPLVQELARFYVYDLSGAMGWAFRVKDAGKLFQCNDLAHYWSPGNHAFLIQSGQELVGFVLVNRAVHDPATDFNMGEFFILRKFQRRGIGRQVAVRIFDRFPGRWEVMQMPDNTPAIAFWRKVIGVYTKGRYSEALSLVSANGKMHNVMSFEAGPRRHGGQHEPVDDL